MKLWYFVTKEAGLWANGNHSIFRSSPRPKPNPLTRRRGEVLIGFLILLENAFPTLAICGYNSLANMQPSNLHFSTVPLWIPQSWKFRPRACWFTLMDLWMRQFGIICISQISTSLYLAAEGYALRKMFQKRKRKKKGRWQIILGRILTGPYVKT